MARTRKATTKDLISAGSIARVTSKTTGKFLGFRVKSNSSDEYYSVTCTKIADEYIWSCTCKAGQAGFVNCKHGECCHVTACKEVCEAHKARTQTEQGEAAVNEAERIVKQAATPALDWRERMERAPLTTHGFSFLR